MMEVTFGLVDATAEGIASIGTAGLDEATGIGVVGSAAVSAIVILVAGASETDDDISEVAASVELEAVELRGAASAMMDRAGIV